MPRPLCINDFIVQPLSSCCDAVLSGCHIYHLINQRQLRPEAENISKKILEHYDWAPCI